MDVSGKAIIFAVYKQDVSQQKKKNKFFRTVKLQETRWARGRGAEDYTSGVNNTETENIRLYIRRRHKAYEVVYDKE
jgi:hypothetical protein